MIAATDVLVSDRGPIGDEHEVIERVHELCRGWRSGMPLAEVRRHSTGADRWTATRFTPPQHTMFPGLMAMLDALVRTDVTDAYGMQYQTPHGTFSEADLRSAVARITRTVDGRLRILFPIRVPWLRRPDLERGGDGERGDPVYADTYDDRWESANRGDVVAHPPRRKEFS